MLLWGARGMGKSALLRASVAAAQAESPGRLGLIELDLAGLPALPDLFAAIGGIDRNFVLYLDDLAFDHGNDAALRHLRSALEGSLAPRPANIRLAVTSNHRAILARDERDQAGALHERDRMDDSLALADRFGLRLGFHPCNQEEYLAIVAAHAVPLGLSWDDAEALSWSRERGPLSGRSAWQFVVEKAGRAGKQV
jgi:predicted AAA+ superfamily ATPase